MSHAFYQKHIEPEGVCQHGQHVHCINLLVAIFQLTSVPLQKPLVYLSQGSTKPSRLQNVTPSSERCSPPARQQRATVAAASA